MIYPKHTPNIVKPLAKDLVFDLPNDDNRIYLTFDDGPHPEITPWVLDELDKVQAKATFFLVGQMIEKHLNVVSEVLKRGHSIGNHSYSHLSGWKTKDQAYFDDIAQCAKLIDTRLFRPPYGQITFSQAKHLKGHFKLIHWSDLSADFDKSFSWEQCLKHATHKVRAGSIIVFHDSEKAWPRLEKALPEALAYYQQQGFVMEAISIQ